MGFGGLREPGRDRIDPEQQRAEHERRDGRQHMASRFHQSLVLDGVAGLADADQGMADADRHIAVDDDAGLSVLAAVEVKAVGAAEILDHEVPVLIVKHLDVPRRHVGIVEDDVVVVAAADAELARVDAEAPGDVAVTGENLDPDHLTTCRPSRKR